MKLLLIAINAKYIHSNLAVYCLRACAGVHKDQVEIAEYTINHQKEDILADIYRRKPDVAAFSCYIWNRNYVSSLVRDFHLLCPEVPIWVGGPEVSYDAPQFLREFPQVKGVMAGEGERSFAALAELYARNLCRRKGEKLTAQIADEAVGYGKPPWYKGEEGSDSVMDGTAGRVWKRMPEIEEGLAQICGLVWRTASGEIHENPPAELMNLDEIPFVYENMDGFAHKIIYYESSRGCPFSCSYCLSSIDKSVRFRSLELVLAELQFFLDQKVPQVKFVDRTFNCNHRHAQSIWRYIAEHDNGITNFHFEIAADLLNAKELSLLASLRPGLAQLEIGVQSVNLLTIHEIDRVMNLTQLKQTVGSIRAGQNIHQHLDLIAGLPYEDYESFIHSFNEVYAMHPQQLQLGFLKVLKGSKMREKAEEYGIVYRQEPPYEVLYSRWISFGEILKLKAVEEMVEVYYNSSQFAYTLAALEKAFPHPYGMFEALAQYYETNHLNGRNHSRMARLEILRAFAGEADGANRELYDELLLLDLYLRENSKSRPAWAKDLTGYKEDFRSFYQKEAEKPEHLTNYAGYSSKQLMHMTHGEVFFYDVLHTGEPLPCRVVFDYRNRDPLTGNASVVKLPGQAADKPQFGEKGCQ